MMQALRGGGRCWWSIGLAALSALGSLGAAGPASPVEFDAAFSGIHALKGRTNEAGRLRALFSLQWRYSMADSPETATYTGFPEFNDRWNDVSRGAIERRKLDVARTRKALASIDASALDPDSRLHHDLFDAYLRMDEEGVRFPSEYLLLNQLQGPQQDVAQTLSLMSASTAGGVRDVLGRLEGAPAYIRQCIVVLREGLARGITPPRIVLRDVPAQVLSLLPEDATKSPFFQPLSSLPSAATEAEKTAWRAQALGSITNGIYPAYRELHRFLTDEYLPGARTHIACVDLPDGKEWYAHRVRRSTTTPLSRPRSMRSGCPRSAGSGQRWNRSRRRQVFAATWAPFSSTCGPRKGSSMRPARRCSRDTETSRSGSMADSPGSSAAFPACRMA